MSTPKIFLSVGSTSTDHQEQFVQAIENYLEANGLKPQTVGRTYFSSQQPLKAIDELMRECVGSVIVGFERTQILNAVERRGSPRENKLENVILPTVWNQIEAAMAYVLGHPLLVIVETNIKPEGLFEHGYDWYVHTVDLDARALTQPSFIGMFNDWKKRCLQSVQLKQRPATAATGISTHASAIQNRDRLITLRQILTKHFSEGELKVLCFDLGVDFQNLPGEEKVVKAMELVSFMQRKNRLDDLVQAARRTQPNVNWTAVI